MEREDAVEYVSFWVDDVGRGGEVIYLAEVRPEDRLVGWQCGFEPLFVAVQIEDEEAEEAEEIARDFLEERGWFGADGPRPADYVI